MPDITITPITPGHFLDEEIEVAVARDDGTVLVVHQCGASILLHRQELQVMIKAIDTAQVAEPSTPEHVVVELLPETSPLDLVAAIMRLRDAP